MSIFSEFREFIARGNVIDLAVGVIVGAAFNDIVKSLVDNVVMPPIGMLLSGIDFAHLEWVLKADNPLTKANELEAYADTTGERIYLDGPEIELPSEVAVSLGMAFHELATNAGKYGSLSVESGRLSVAWRITEGESGRRLNLTWRESDGPAVTAPTRTGFGSRLLDNVITGQLHGRVSINFAPEGLTAKIEAALDLSDYATRSNPQ